MGVGKKDSDADKPKVAPQSIQSLSAPKPPAIKMSLGAKVCLDYEAVNTVLAISLALFKLYELKSLISGSKLKVAISLSEAKLRRDKKICRIFTCPSGK